MTLVFISVALLVILGTALVLTGRLDTRISSTGRPGPDPLPEGNRWTADDVRGLSFRIGLRGYRMSDVDAALARLAEQMPAGSQHPPDPESPPDAESPAASDSASSGLPDEADSN